ncbi:MAG: cation-translocating P-type ATPase [Flavobacteriaceae bacterium]
MSVQNFDVKGLNAEEVLNSRKKHGDNALDYKKENAFLRVIKSLFTEPMVILLLVTASIYFAVGDVGDGLFLAVAILLVSAISLYQDSRSRNALEKLKTISQPHCNVIRNGHVEEIAIADVVVGDSLMVEEGTTIPADGTIIHSNDFSVDESILTGESLSVYKDKTKEDPVIFRGTTVVSGLAIATVTAVGNRSQLGKIGKSLEEIKEEKTPLEIQIGSFVKKMAAIGVIVFLIVWAFNYYNSFNVLDSLLKALTLAMSILPEEIPVAFTTFMALGAWRLMKMGVVVKQMKTVETLGSATVICVDKTGTITKNEMDLAKLFVLRTQEISDPTGVLATDQKELIRLAMWASEPIPFDPMEIAIHKAYEHSLNNDERPLFNMVHEYPLGGKPPMMTHLFEDSEGHRIISAKGAPEAFFTISNLTDSEKEQLQQAIATLAKDGYRLLGVGEALFSGDDFPKKQQEFVFQFKGLLAFYDPPKDNIQAVFEAFQKAGVAVKIITGDNSITTRAIASQIKFKGSDYLIEGADFMKLEGAAAQKAACDNQIFTRMFPDAKLKVIKALKEKGEIVAMTGDGVNDGPALKAAHIGVAMGKRGTEIAKQSASLILLEDDLTKMVDAVAMGRKIYTNLKKAIQYVISIHIPIIFMVFLPLALRWIYPNIFSPVHVILLELIMGPTCSIIYENEPMEKNTMTQRPRPFTSTFFNWKELVTSIIQGLAITAGGLLIYQYAVGQEYTEPVTRAMVFTTLIAANIFLTLVNRSFYYSIWVTMGYKNNLVSIMIGITILITALLLFVPPLTHFFQFETLSVYQLAVSATAGCVFVIWYELVKFRKRSKSQKATSGG